MPFSITVIIPYFISSSGTGSLLEMIIGGLFGITGVFLLFYTIRLFGLIGKGTLAPWHPTQKLVVAGPYRYVRNPMISGVFFILVGEMIFFHSASIGYLAGIFFVINTAYFIAVEEPSLEQRFGNDYVEYKKHVRRWIPRVKPYVV